MTEAIEQNSWHKITEGDSELWRRFLQAQIPVIYQMFMRLWPNRSLAEELTQKTVFDAVKAKNTYDPAKASPGTWVMAIARNNLAAEARKRAARPNIDGDITTWLNIIDTQPLPDEVLEKRETAEVVRKSLNGLATKESGVLKAKYIEDLSARQIAHKMGLTEKAVHSLLYRARISLRDKLKSLNPQNEEAKK